MLKKFIFLFILFFVPDGGTLDLIITGTGTPGTQTQDYSVTSPGSASNNRYSLDDNDCVIMIRCEIEDEVDDGKDTKVQ